MTLKAGDRVKAGMSDRDGNNLYGTVIDPNFLGIAALVKCDTLVSKEYCYTDDKDVMFLRDQLTVIKKGEPE